MRSVPVKQNATRSGARCGAHKRDLAALEERRLQAAEVFEEGLIPAEIARRVGVRHQIVSQRRKAWREGGRDALRSDGPVGRRPKLTAEQLQVVNAA